MLSGRLHMVPVSETHQFRPTLTYLDIMSRKTRRSRGGAGSDSESDDGPPPDPDEPAPVAPAPKKERKPVEAKEVQISARKSADEKNNNLQGGISSFRREVLLALRAEEDEPWQVVEFCSSETEASEQAFQALLSHSEEQLKCQTGITTLLRSIKGL
ncbi:hypothetical protein ID866_606 [Astraeus odoratus]|nr:hypothetical protein ID866_606 [Astraeus odoratus]